MNWREKMLSIPSNRETEEKLINKFNQHKGELVIDHPNILRLIGLGCDEYDWFYVLYDGKKLVCPSVLFGFIPLKNKIDEKDYNNLIRLNKLNHADFNDVNNIHYDDEKSAHDNLKYREDYREGILSGIKDELIVDVCWDMN